MLSWPCTPLSDYTNVVGESQGSPQDFKFPGAQAIAARRAACRAPERSEGAKLCAKGAGVGMGGEEEG